LIQVPGSGINIPYYIFWNSRYQFFGLKHFKNKFIDAYPDPGSCQPRFRDPGWKKDPGQTFHCIERVHTVILSTGTSYIVNTSYIVSLCYIEKR
jgi:hypothetical protein